MAVPLGRAETTPSVSRARASEHVASTKIAIMSEDEPHHQIRFLRK